MAGLIKPKREILGFDLAEKGTPVIDSLIH